MGSAQQYQFSDSRGTALPVCAISSAGACLPAGAWASFQIPAKISGRDSPAASARVTQACTSCCRASTRGSGLLPRVAEDAGIEGTYDVIQFRQMEYVRAGRDQQADRELHRRDRLDQLQLGQQLQQFDVVVQRGPRGKGHEGGCQVDIEPAHQLQCLDEIRARVPLVELLQDGIIDRFHGGENEQAAGLLEFCDDRPGS